ncbi:MAG: hypothetical protein C5B50_25985 [Verrucomicrobia bacterium]|nr:MAG: hypothetical protein C5B50_25985 [Verrucomicrobiota bacterium]
MTEDQQSLEEALFELAEQKSSPAERAAFLDGVCRDNPALRARLEVLLEGHFGASDFLPRTPKGPAASEPAAPPPPAPPEPPADESPARTIGRYKLLEKIGEGGFGEVWMAEQREPVKRRVALKILKLGMDTRQIVARFEAERQALAMMDHANIAKVFDAGTTGEPPVTAPVAEPVNRRTGDSPSRPLADTPFQLTAGRPYFVMELVRGSRITDYCDQNALPTGERLRLFILVCQAIQHAHQKGIIHRDIKPSNILVTLHDGVPVPKVIDFGIAKATQGELTDKTLFTQFHQFIGTPAYISPEQAEASGLDVDTRSDIYSLGVLLYELLVGQTPFDAKEMMKGGLDSLRQIIREKEPLKPSTRFKTLPAAELTTTAQRRQTDAMKLSHLLRGDLDWIVMKCLEKDRARRYEAANGLALDIQHYLANEPIAARPPSALYRLQKLVRRNKLTFSAAALVALVLVIGVSAVIFVQHRANKDYRQRLYLSEVSRAGAAWQAGQSAQMLALLERCPPDLRHWEWQFLRKQADRWDQTAFLSTTNLAAALISANGRLVAAATGRVIQILEFPSGHWLRDIPFELGWHTRLAVSPRDELLATLDGETGIITVWNMRTGQTTATMTYGPGIEALAVSADGQWLASGGHDRTIRISDAKTGRQLRTFSTTAIVRALEFSPDDKSLAVGMDANTAQLLDASTGAVKRTFPTHGDSVTLLKFSPDGRNLVVASRSHDFDPGDARVWSLDQEGSLDLGKQTGAASFSPDNRQLVVSDAAGTIRLWDLNQRAEVERFSANAMSVQWLQDGRIFCPGRDDQVRICQARKSGIVQLKGYPSALRTLAFSPDSRWLAAAGVDHRIFLWDAQSEQLGEVYTNSGAGTALSPLVYTNHSGSAFAVAFSPDGRAASTGSDRKVQVWDPASRRMIWERSLAPAADAYWLVFSPDGRRLYAASQREVATVFDAATGKPLNTINGLGDIVDGLAISPDGRLLAICQKVNLSVWLADGSRQLWEAPANPERCAAFSPDGKWIATGDQDGKVSLWEVASAGRGRRTLSGHTASVSGVSFHPDGRRLVSSSFDGQVKVWDLQSGTELLTIPIPGGNNVWHAIFSPDGKMLAAAGSDGVVTLCKTQ